MKTRKKRKSQKRSLKRTSATLNQLTEELKEKDKLEFIRLKLKKKQSYKQLFSKVSLCMKKKQNVNQIIN